MSLIITVMVINMQEERLDSIESLEQFLAGTAGVSPMVAGGEADRQAYVQRVLSRFGYSGLSRWDKGVVIFGADEWLFAPASGASDRAVCQACPARLTARSGRRILQTLHRS